jgi:hypothetical protein
MQSYRLYRPLRWQWALVVLSLWLATPAWPDEVHLMNGDRLTGTIVSMDAGVLTLQTDYGGEVKIDWGKVHRLSSDSPLKLLVPGEYRDPIRTFFYGTQALEGVRELGPDGPISLADIKAINLDPVRLTGTVTIGGNSMSGNSSTKAFNGATRLTLNAHRQRLLFEGKYNYGLPSAAVSGISSLTRPGRCCLFPPVLRM